MSNVAKLQSQYRATTDNQHIAKVRLIASGTISSSATGTIYSVLNANPSSGSEWSSYAAIYDEARVLGMKISLIPVQQGTVTSINSIGAILFDNDDSTALTSLNAGLEYDNAVIIPAIWYQDSGHATQYIWARPTAGKNTAIPWVDVAVPSGNNGSIKLAFAGLTSTTAYFIYCVEWLCEFRGRR
jgi:hypothetical protein